MPSRKQSRRKYRSKSRKIRSRRKSRSNKRSYHNIRYKKRSQKKSRRRKTKQSGGAEPVPGPEEQTLEARFTRDLIVIGGDEGVIIILNAETGDIVKTLEGHRTPEDSRPSQDNDGITRMVMSAKFSPPDGQHIVSASADETVRVWSVATGACERILEGHSGWVNSAQFSPDGQHIVSASDDQTVRVWSVATGACERILEGHSEAVTFAQFSPDGQHIVSASDDDPVRVWSVATGGIVQTLGNDDDNFVYSAQFSPDGQHIVSGSWDNTLRVWRVLTGQCVQTLEGHRGAVYSVQFSPDGQHIVSASADQTVRVWSMASGDCVQTLEPSDDRGPMFYARFSPDGNRIISVNVVLLEVLLDRPKLRGNSIIRVWELNQSGEWSEIKKIKDLCSRRIPSDLDYYQNWGFMPQRLAFGSCLHERNDNSPLGELTPEIVASILRKM